MAFVVKQLNAWKTFGGTVTKVSHASTAVAGEMKFCIFVPNTASKAKPVPTLYWLAGLTCNEDTFMWKAGACRAATEHNVAIVCPDTSPRDAKVDGESTNGWDFGVGAGFYLNATQPKWSKHWNMFDYVTKELPKFVRANFPVSDKQSVFGHSMGGHGALVCYLKNPGMFSSCSAFAPICHPSIVPWGTKAFAGYLGDSDADKATWKNWDATHLIGSYTGAKTEILVDQGTSDEWLTKNNVNQLQTEKLVAAAKAASHPMTVNFREGFDHSYYTISTFIDNHVAFHAKALGAEHTPGAAAASAGAAAAAKK